MAPTAAPPAPVPTKKPSDRQLHVEAFARTLSDLRQAAGCPSFRQMATVSGCISHATLHEATRGKRLPTWETTEQFLLALGLDPRQWRAEWCRADRLVNRSTAPAVDEVAPMPPAPVAPVEEPEEPVREPAPSRRGWWLPAVAAAGVLTLVFGAAFLAARWGAGPRTAAIPAAGSAATPAAGAAATSAAMPAASTSAMWCAGPGERIEHTWTSSVVSGGGMSFRDGRLSECSVVRPNSAPVKGFTLRNTGRVAWRGWRLHLMNSSGPCRIDGAEFRLPTVAPGQPFLVSIGFSTTDGTGLCHAEWEVRDGAGHPVFPGASRIPLTVMVATG